MRQAVLLLQTRQLAKALAAHDTILTGPSLTRDGLAAVHYNRACILSRMGRRPEALNALETAVGCGYSNARSLLTDPDLDALREEAGFMALLNNASASIPQVRLAGSPSPGP
jgi:predicted RNA polymerase sigma factor